MANRVHPEHSEVDGGDGVVKFDERVKSHLSVYKAKAGIIESGFWKQNGKAYSHILPESQQALNILVPYRGDFWKYCGLQEHLKLHHDFHHLNSSQALCFNLFAPFVIERTFELLYNALGMGTGRSEVEPRECRFERVFDATEGTNFDFFLQRASGTRLYFEIKYSETHFGFTEEDERHRGKLETIYRPRLTGKVSPHYLDGPAFFSNYQILRNLCYLDSDSHVFFIVPRGNEALADGIKVITEAPTDRYRDSIHVVFLEELLDRMLASRLPERMKNHFELFREKYIVA